MGRVNKMFLGNLHQSNFVILVRLFFGVTGTGFAFIGQSQYALISLMIALVVSVFTYQISGSFQSDDAQISFGLELEMLADFATYGLIPAVLLLFFSQGALWALVVMALYLLAAAVRLAHFNRPLEHQGLTKPIEEFHQGLPLMSSALILPLLSLLGFMIELILFKYFFGVLLLILAAGYIINYPVPKISGKYLLYILIGIGLVIVLYIILGPIG